MGRGSRTKEESRTLSSAANLRAAALEGRMEGAEGDSAQEESPCEAAKTLAVLFTIPSSVKRGDAVKLRLGIPPAVLARGTEVGHVQEPDASYAEACLLEGYTLGGSVQSINLESGAGTILVTGKKR